jgi:hypothetical protein
MSLRYVYPEKAGATAVRDGLLLFAAEPSANYVRKRKSDTHDDDQDNQPKSDRHDCLLTPVSKLF